jgi:hypothetical protein
MLWPLDEGAAVPLCVRTVDQGAPDGGCRYLYVSFPRSVAGSCVCALWARLCWSNGRLQQMKFSDAPRGPPLHTFGTRS